MSEMNETVHDVVCGMPVEKTETEYTTEHDGSTYYFCSDECKEKFDAAPHSYLGEIAA